MSLSSEAVNEIFNSQAEMFGVIGLAWFVKGGDSPPIIGACGVRRSLEAGDPSAISGEEVFHWGSCSKALSATLVLQLIEDPSVPLEWDTQLAQALPRLELPAAVGTITVHHYVLSNS